GSIAGYMTDEREENSQKDEVENKLILYIFPSNRTKLFFYRHLLGRYIGKTGEQSWILSIFGCL
ncbi:MAG: hypothetical protein UHS55_04210, partial [Prevotella sp.]|nr:hypothetical protein [Prevotella sp.]